MRHDREYEDTTPATVRVKTEAQGLPRASYCSTVGTTEGRITRERGTIVYDWAKQRIEHRTVGQQESTVLELDVGEHEDAFAWEQRSFAEWVLLERPPVVTAQDGRATVELCQAAYLSAERGAPGRVPLEAVYQRQPGSPLALVRGRRKPRARNDGLLVAMASRPCRARSTAGLGRRQEGFDGSGDTPDPRRRLRPRRTPPGAPRDPHVYPARG